MGNELKTKRSATGCKQPAARRTKPNAVGADKRLMLVQELYRQLSANETQRQLLLAQLEELKRQRKQLKVALAMGISEQFLPV